MELSEILLARETRVKHQNELLQQYQLPLICFTMNIAGPEKNSPLITKGFKIGDRLLRAQLSNIRYSETRLLPTGCEAYYVVDASPHVLKSICTQIEESLPLGRLFDMDVLATDGSKCSRELPRKCLLCQQDARICARSRAHGLPALQKATKGLLLQAVIREQSEGIASLAQQALLYELLTTPKPGLVDCHNNGSHRDMDVFTFARSISALASYFQECARIGIETAEQSPQEVFSLLRFCGKNAEAAMYTATGGKNTHKGAIFSLGLLCAAAGRVGEEASPAQITEACAMLCKGVVATDLSALQPGQERTHGEQLYARFGLTGVRGQAERGFPTVLHVGLPYLQRGLSQGFPLARAGAAALLAMLCAEPDTCLISRSSLERYKTLRDELSALLSRIPYPGESTLAALDVTFIRENLSPGGAADLLALTYFLHEWEHAKQAQS